MVLLILAVVTISLVFSDNGIIAKAINASEETSKATINEQEILNYTDEYINSVINNSENLVPDEPVDPTENWDTTKVDKIVSGDNIVVPVPKGYIASSVSTENTVQNGFVIYEGTEVVNDSNVEDARIKRNQFVWVPVENTSEMYGIDIDGKAWGKLYTFSEIGINPLNWEENNGVIQIKKSTDDESYREPDILTSFDTNINLPEYNVGANTQEDFNIQLETEFNNMIRSVEKYGGFYIGRYETGNLSQSEAVVIKNNSDNVRENWYTQYSLSKTIAANNNITSTMIWGCQWDATMRWMYESGDEFKKIYTYNSEGKGNYKSSSTIPTGTVEDYAMNNIYDMAGNVVDWTIEANSNSYRISRGGNINYSGSDDPASERYIDDTPTTNNAVYGSRSALYIN